MKSGVLCLVIVSAGWFAAPGADAQVLEFPMRADDLLPGERLSTGPHGGGALGIQNFALDIGAMRHTGNDIWHAFDGDPPAVLQDAENEELLVYGKPFYAMAAGEVIGCWRLAPENIRPGIVDVRVLGEPGPAPKVIIPGGNHLWIRHDDGTVALYAHAIPDTIPERLCPGKDQALLPASAPATPFSANPDVDPAAFVPEGIAPTQATETMVGGQVVRRPRVRQGEELGLVGNSGSSGGPHLHVHLETGFGASPSQPIRMRFERGMFGLRVPLGDFLHQANIDNWVALTGNPLPTDTAVLVWPPSTLAREVSRVALSIDAFGRVFDHLADSGFMPDVIDCYFVGGEAFFNMIWKPAQGPWSTVAGVDETGFLTAALEADGLDLHALDICAAPNGARYAAIFRPVDGAPVVRAALTEGQHEALLLQMREAEMTPVAVSVASIGGERVYAVVYHPVDRGEWTVASRLRRTSQVDEYDDFVDEAFAGSRKPVYVSAYMHNGVEHFVSIVAERPDGQGKARHNRGSEAMRELITESVFDGFLTRSIAGLDGTSNHRHAAVWIDPPAIVFNGGLIGQSGGLVLGLPDGRVER